MAKRIQRSALVAYSPQQMFDLVNSIDDYPKFMDGCVGAEVLQRGDQFVEARLDLRKGKFAQSFVTRNQLHEPDSIEMHLVDGPFKKLEGVWSFEVLGDQGCKVGLSLEFEFKNKLLALAASNWFESTANTLVDSVCQRAKVLYG